MQSLAFRIVEDRGYDFHLCVGILQRVYRTQNFPHARRAPLHQSQRNVMAACGGIGGRSYVAMIVRGSGRSARRN
jgi:hypothetical protein